ncbi:LysR family transcriptional regulator [Streptomyces kunmingensis]|uniref:LysR family transcriptional regulator n=1 Tax=Streptomyces kunmingensis TaxID=68225 RepID=A0ABU6CG92_9ACTN|nr:LysR family transcriptional regulator [Streptomyces kunmingensis]MEB3963201.1 LysR family transcriptional regulator [Streptomyces kunmingensis]
MLTERHLEIFVAIAEEGHFGDAAQRVGISQPPLSQALRRLEALLGVRLFDRERGVFLTDEGAALLPHARRALSALAELRETGARQSADGHRLRIGLPPELPPRLGAIVAASPVRAGLRARVSVVTAPTATLLTDVSAGRLDLAVVRHPVVLHGLSAGPVTLLPTWLLEPDGGAGPGAAASSPSDAGHRPQAGRSWPYAVRPRAEAPAAHDLFLDTLAGQGRRVETVVISDERAGLALVAAGQAMLVTADPALSAEGVVRRPTTDPSLPLRLRVVWDARRLAAAHATEAAEIMADALASSDPSGGEADR